jgi:hypothetical protein
VTLFGLALWPNLVTASNNSAYSLTIRRASSSEKTLGIMLVIALIGMPLVLTYTTIAYWTFRRVEVGELLTNPIQLLPLAGPVEPSQTRWLTDPPPSEQRVGRATQLGHFLGISSPLGRKT